MPLASIVVVAPAVSMSFLLADCLNDAVDSDNRVGVENGAVKISAEEQSDISDQ